MLFSLRGLLFGFFFFQAEDGIRDLTVTGVQTCALPISILVAGRSGSAITAQIGMMRVTKELDALAVLGISPSLRLVLPRVLALACAMPRSEERRVGKEGRSRWSPHHRNKKTMWIRCAPW